MGELSPAILRALWLLVKLTEFRTSGHLTKDLPETSFLSVMGLSRPEKNAVY
jgi:hypothetical protein